jgi:hypothetical protein
MRIPTGIFADSKSFLGHRSVTVGLGKVIIYNNILKKPRQRSRDTDPYTVVPQGVYIGMIKYPLILEMPPCLIESCKENFT